MFRFQLRSPVMHSKRSLIELGSFHFCYWCCEECPFTTTNPSQRANHDKEEAMTFIQKYQQRPTRYERNSLDEYFYIDRQKHKLSHGISHFIGLPDRALSAFPVTPADVRHAIIVYKPWRIQPTDNDYPTTKDCLDEFNKFINHNKCPRQARIEYDRLMQRYYDGTKFIDPVSCSSDRTKETE